MAPSANSAGDGASAVVTKLITNGRSNALGMWSSDHAIRLASAGQGGRLSRKLWPLRRHEAQLGPQRQIAVDDARAERKAELLAVAGRGDIDAVDLGLARPHEAALELGIAGEVAAGQHDAAARAEARACPRASSHIDADDATPSSLSSATARVGQADVDAARDGRRGPDAR